MNTNTYKVVKLISGENIICDLTLKADDVYEVINPLLIYVRPSMGHRGEMTESLMLTRWVQPFTDDECFDIDKSHIIVTLNASPALALYYEGILNKYGNSEEIGHLDLYNDSTYNDPSEDEIYDELLEELETSNKLIH
jgi:hypothetical protein